MFFLNHTLYANTRKAILLPITLLHHTNFFNDLLKICVNRNLFDGDHLAGFLVHRFEYRAIGAVK